MSCFVRRSDAHINLFGRRTDHLDLPVAGRCSPLAVDEELVRAAQGAIDSRLGSFRISVLAQLTTELETSHESLMFMGYPTPRGALTNPIGAAECRDSKCALRSRSPSISDPSHIAHLFYHRSVCEIQEPLSRTIGSPNPLRTPLAGAAARRHKVAQKPACVINDPTWGELSVAIDSIRLRDCRRRFSRMRARQSFVG